MPVRSGRSRFSHQSFTPDGAGRDIFTARHQDVPVVPPPVQAHGTLLPPAFTPAGFREVSPCAMPIKIRAVQTGDSNPSTKSIAS